MKRRVVVTGLGALTPLGNSVEESWEGAIAGKSGIGAITKFDSAAFKSRIAGEIKNFDPSGAAVQASLGVRLGQISD